MSLDPRLVALADRVRSLARQRGRDELVRALDWRLEALAAAGPLTLVVAGRTNSGKSTLVNALLGRPVVAAGSDVPTTAPAVIGYGACESARVHRGIEPEPVALEQAAVIQRESGDVELYELHVDHPLLASGLRLVDTPGVDASGGPQRARALEQVLRADVLVFVFDPLAPLSRPEARFLEKAASALADVIFVIGKADIALDVEPMVAADRALVQRIAPAWADAPLFVLSALEKTVADGTGDDELAVQSGVPAFERHVADRLSPHVEVVRSAGFVQACRSTLRELELSDRSALEGDDRAAALADAAIADHRAYVEATAPDWALEFGREYHRRARQVIERDLRLRLLERREGREVRIKSGAVALEEVTAAVVADLSDVAAHLQQALIEQVAALISEWTARLELTAVHLPKLSVAPPGEIVMPAPEVGNHHWQGRERVQGFAGLVNLARSAAAGRSFAGLLPGGLAMGTGIGIVMTGLSWGTSEWLRHKVQDQQGALAFVQAAFSRGQIELETALREHALELQPVAQAALQRSIDERRRELALDAARLQQEAEAAAVDNGRARAMAAERLQELEPFAHDVDDLAERFTAFLRTGSLPGSFPPPTLE